MTVRRMLAEMTSREFTEWMVVYEKIEPFGESRMDARAGSAVSPLVNILLSIFARNPKLTELGDWIMDFAGDAPKGKPQTDDEIKALLLSRCK